MQWFMTDYLIGKLLNHLDGSSYSPAATVYLSLHTTPPAADGTGTEVSGGGYARKAITMAAAANGEISTSAAIDWTPLKSTGAVTVVGASIWDASSAGNMLFFAQVNPFTKAIGTDLTVPAGGLTVAYATASHVSEYLANKWLDRVLRNRAWSTPSLYLGVTTDEPQRDGTYTEVSGGGYARTLVGLGTAADGEIANSATESFAPLHSTTAQDVVGWILADASTAGNLLLAGNFYADGSAVAVPSGNTLSWAAGAITIEGA